MFRTCISKKSASLAAAHLSRILAHEECPILFLCSGGSALDILKKVTLPRACTHLTLGVLDERFSRDPKINNYLHLQATKFFSTAVKRGARYITTVPEEGENLQRFAIQLEYTLRAWKRNHPEGRIVITQGMGADGHTAGIMPFPEDRALFDMLFNDPEQWITGYDAGSKSPFSERVTVTMPFLEIVDESVMYVVGEEKRTARERALSSSSVIAETPATIVQNMKNVTLYTDLTELPA